MRILLVEDEAEMATALSSALRRYDMVVSGPNTQGFANIAAGLCPTFSPALDKNARPLSPTRALGTRQISVVSQSGGLGFAFSADFSVGFFACSFAAGGATDCCALAPVAQTSEEVRIAIASRFVIPRRHPA